MALGDGTAWDEASPAASGQIPQGDDEIRDLRIGVRIRMEKEHVTPATSSAGGTHKQGSAISYVVADATARDLVVNRPDAATALGNTSADIGRLLLQLDTKLLYYWSGTAWVAYNANATFTQTPEGYVLLEHKTATGSNGGGDFTAAAWRTRTLTVETSDVATLCALNTSTNQFTLTAGTYRFRIRVPAYKVGKHIARLKNVTDTSYTYGTNADAGASVEAQTWSEIIGRFTIGSTKTFEIQHICETTKTSNGMGVSGDGLDTGAWTSQNVYTQAEFWKEVT